MYLLPRYSSEIFYKVLDVTNKTINYSFLMFLGTSNANQNNVLVLFSILKYSTEDTVHLLGKVIAKDDIKENIVIGSLFNVQVKAKASKKDVSSWHAELWVRGSGLVIGNVPGFLAPLHSNIIEETPPEDALIYNFNTGVFE